MVRRRAQAEVTSSKLFLVIVLLSQCIWLSGVEAQAGSLFAEADRTSYNHIAAFPPLSPYPLGENDAGQLAYPTWLTLRVFDSKGILTREFTVTFLL